ncbi:MAG: NADH-quinone oxidoreductase subunit J [Acidimicrobiales bacterium]
MELVVFVAAALVCLAGAVGVVLSDHPVHSALSLVGTLFGIAVLFIAQDAEFLAAVQIIVYAGAIVVLFLFVIMLLGVDRTEDLRVEPSPVSRWAPPWPPASCSPASPPWWWPARSPASPPPPPPTTPRPPT